MHSKWIDGGWYFLPAATSISKSAQRQHIPTYVSDFKGAISPNTGSLRFIFPNGHCSVAALMDRRQRGLFLPKKCPPPMLATDSEEHTDAEIALSNRDIRKDHVFEVTDSKQFTNPESCQIAEKLIYDLRNRIARCHA